MIEQLDWRDVMEIDLSGMAIFAVIGVIATLSGAGWLVWLLVGRLF